MPLRKTRSFLECLLLLWLLVFLLLFCFYLGSGTTWAKKIMPLILNGADTSKLTNIFDMAPEIGCVGEESHSGIYVVGPRFLISYLPLRLMPRECLEKDCKVLGYNSELGYDGLNGTRKTGPSYEKSVVNIYRILDMHQTGTKHIVRHMQKTVVQWSVISKFTCIVYSPSILFTIDPSII